MGVLIKILVIPVSILAAIFGSIAGLFASLFRLFRAAIIRRKMKKGPIPCPNCAGKIDPGTGMFSNDVDCLLCEGKGMIKNCTMCNPLADTDGTSSLDLFRSAGIQCISCDGWGILVGNNFIGYKRKSTPANH